MAEPEFPFPKPNVDNISFYDIQDGMKVNADVWNEERQCQLERQKLYHQSLCEPGIVFGLRVRVKERTKNSIYFEVEAGLAIAQDGEFLIWTRDDQANRKIALNISPRSNLFYSIQRQGDVPIQRFMCIRKETPEEQKRDFGNTISGQKLTNNGDEKPRKIKHRYIIDIVTKIESDSENDDSKKEGSKPVELCRFSCNKAILNNEEIISKPKQFYQPKVNELDFRFRRYFKPRVTKCVRVAFLQLDFNYYFKDISLVEQSFRELTTAVDALYPNLHLQPMFDSIQVSTENSSRETSNKEKILGEVDCLFWKIDYEDIEHLTVQEDAPKSESSDETQGSESSSPQASDKPFPQVPAQVPPQPSAQPVPDLPEQSPSELNENEPVEENVQEHQEPAKVYRLKPHILEELKYYLSKGAFLWIETPRFLADYPDLMEELCKLDPEHDTGKDKDVKDKDSDIPSPIFRTPFTFVGLPSAPNNWGHPMDIKTRSHLLLCQGELSLAWLSLAAERYRYSSPNTSYFPSRSEIRDAQEFGINILNFIWDLQQVRGFYVDPP